MSENKRTFHYADERPDGTRLPMNPKQKWSIFIVALVVVVVISILVTVKIKGKNSTSETMAEGGETTSDVSESQPSATMPGVPVTNDYGQFVTDDNGNTVTESFPTETTEPTTADAPDPDTTVSGETDAPTDIGNADPTQTADTRENPETGRIIVDVDREDFNFIVVNRTREMPDGFVPTMKEVVGSGIYMDYRVAPHYEEMYYAAKQDGITLTPYSGYRSYERQKNNLNNRIATNQANGMSYDEAYAEATSVILPPGTSEHNLGLAMDVCNVYDSFANQPEYAWLMEHAHEYGFILRYTAEKQSITGIVPEPWHWRYVGVPYAQQIKESGLCLEEWLTAQGIAY